MSVDSWRSIIASARSVETYVRNARGAIFVAVAMSLMLRSPLIGFLLVSPVFIYQAIVQYRRSRPGRGPAPDDV